MNGQQLQSVSDVNKLRIFREALFAGRWVADTKRRGQA